jgi:hypothetical protein
MLPRTYPHLHLHRMGGSAEGRKSAQRRSAARLVTQRGPWSGAADQLEDPCGVHWALRTTGGHEPLERVAVTSRPRRAVYSTPRLRALPSLADSLTSRAPGGTTVSRFLTSATTLLAVMSWAAPVLAETLRVQLPWTHQGAVRWVLRADARRFYQREGLDVSITPGGTSRDGLSPSTADAAPGVSDRHGAL